MQVSTKMRRAKDAYLWFCPACQSMHHLPDGWTFDGNVDAPTFTPSFKHTWHMRSAEKKDKCCHYIITKGRVAYCGDCTHGMAGQIIDMPDLPHRYQDGPDCVWSDCDE